MRHFNMRIRISQRCLSQLYYLTSRVRTFTHLIGEAHEEGRLAGIRNFPLNKPVE